MGDRNRSYEFVLKGALQSTCYQSMLFFVHENLTETEKERNNFGFKHSVSPPLTTQMQINMQKYL